MEDYGYDTGRLVSPEMEAIDSEENSLRPHTLEDYVGQEKVKENLRIYLEAARRRGEAMDHILLYGLPAWARPLWRASWPRRWACRSA